MFLNVLTVTPVRHVLSDWRSSASRSTRRRCGPAIRIGRRVRVDGSTGGKQEGRRAKRPPGTVAFRSKVQGLRSWETLELNCPIYLCLRQLFLRKPLLHGFRAHPSSHFRVRQSRLRIDMRRSGVNGPRSALRMREESTATPARSCAARAEPPTAALRKLMGPMPSPAISSGQNNKNADNR